MIFGQSEQKSNSDWRAHTCTTTMHSELYVCMYVFIASYYDTVNAYINYELWYLLQLCKYLWMNVDKYKQHIWK